MKSRISFFNGTVFKKNITRFAPVWALYSVFLLLFMVALGVDNNSFYFSQNIASTIGFFAIVNIGYALVCAQLLFGDLYSSRMCNALHAMPLRREDWFCTNVITGLAFSLIPNAAFALICIPLAGNLLIIPFLWLAAVTLQYLFFFGTAVLAAYCVGNRFAMALVYIIINCFSLIAYWLVETMYAPLMYGVVIREDVFFTLSPLVKMVTCDGYLEVEKQGGYAFARWYFAEGWGYLGICAAIGVVLMVLALAAYRKRNLECAGDFIAIQWLSPIFLTLYTLCGGACFHGFCSLFIGEENYIFLILGFVIGFFTGRMLLDRTVRIFRKKTFLGFGAFMLAFSLSFIAVNIDLFGITHWVPKADRLTGVAISTTGNYGYNNWDTPLTDPAAIEDILAIHRYGLANRYEGSDGEADVKIYITYYMKDGSERKREYYINRQTETGRLVKAYTSSPEMVLGRIYTGEWKVKRIEIPEAIITVIDPAEIQSLLEAIIADAKAGNMPQDWNYASDADYQFWLEAECELPSGINSYRSIRASSDCPHLIAWLESHSLYAVAWEKYLENGNFEK